MRVLVAFEDHYFKPLEILVKRRLTPTRPAGDPPYPEVLFHTARGNTNFERYVASTWRNVRPSGLPGNPGLLDHLVCVVDADRLGEFVDVGAPNAGNCDDWHRRATETWNAFLRSHCDSSVPTATVHGALLRWSKESLALAAYDHPAAASRLGLDVTSDAAKKYLAACDPRPDTVEAGQFTNTFRKPLRCLSELCSATGLAPLGKNAPEIDDLLGDIKADASAVFERIPDVDAVASIAWRVAGEKLDLGDAAPSSPSATPAKRSPKSPKLKRK